MKWLKNILLLFLFCLGVFAGAVFFRFGYFINLKHHAQAIGSDASKYFHYLTLEVENDYPHYKLKIKSKHKKNLKKLRVNVAGPFPADSVFTIYRKYKFDVIVGMYHDQVLAPFKAFNSEPSISIIIKSLSFEYLLPITLLRVDVGTKLLYALDIPDHPSIKDAPVPDPKILTSPTSSLIAIGNISIFSFQLFALIFLYKYFKFCENGSNARTCFF